MTASGQEKAYSEDWSDRYASLLVLCTRAKGRC